MLNYFEERKLYDIARAMSKDEAMIFLKVFLLEKGMYPEFQNHVTTEDMEYMQNPNPAIYAMPLDVSRSIGKTISENINCELCPFKTIHGCTGDCYAKIDCENKWTRWFQSMLRSI